MELTSNFDQWFENITKFKPFPYQRRMALENQMPSVVSVPTGLGKTAAVILGWLWQRRFAGEEVRRRTPCRLIYCLPMRVLVEQTRNCARSWLMNAGLLAQELGEPEKIGVHVLLGGEVDLDWDLYPEREAILVGTQDMLLSRALNRGYAMSRFRWPIHFALLNNDCLWVMDEVQLMGNGLATTTQLQAFRRKLGAFGPVHSIWMSATIRPEWLRTVDFDEAEANGFLNLKEEDRSTPLAATRLNAAKPLEKAPFTATEDGREEASLILKSHRPGSLTLVVVNTVRRAMAIYQSLGEETPKVLLHSRFRFPERKKAMEKLVSQIGESGLIAVTTQVVEAGVDVSAATLITDLAPWSSLVQRFGRCNRRGEYGCEKTDDKDAATKGARVIWIDLKTSGRKTISIPYDVAYLELARKVLKGKEDVGPSLLESTRITLDDETKFPLRFTRVIRRHDLFGLFSTEPDLSGGFTDVSGFVRDPDPDVDVRVFWRRWEGNKPSSTMGPPKHKELCPVPVSYLRDFLGPHKTAWEWNDQEGDWQRRRGWEVCPGMTLLLSQDQGGYDEKLGWTGEVKHIPPLWEWNEEAAGELDLGDELNGELSSLAVLGWQSLEDHLQKVRQEAEVIVIQSPVAQTAEGADVVTAALYHDIGKALPPWQQAGLKYVESLKEWIKESLNKKPETRLFDFYRSFLESLDNQPKVNGFWAKFPGFQRTAKKANLNREGDQRILAGSKIRFKPGLRHEAASALGVWRLWRRREIGLNGLVVYLVAAHHGKVRTVLRSTGAGQDVFGVDPGAQLPPIASILEEPMELDLSPRLFGAHGVWSEDGAWFEPTGPSWVNLVGELLGPELDGDPDPREAVPENEPRSLGPFRLAYLEALVRAADRRASLKSHLGG
ncbi:MAG: CRISPR-associated helicase Cas3' [Thermodesulfobacteriota bacterium]